MPDGSSPAASSSNIFTIRISIAIPIRSKSSSGDCARSSVSTSSRPCVGSVMSSQSRKPRLPPIIRKMRADPRTWSIAARLFFSAAVLSTAILLVAGIGLSALYRKEAESRFDDRLGVYLRALVADIASPSEENKTGSEPFDVGEPQFEIAYSGWYWQITRVDDDHPDIKSSRSLFAARLPKLADMGVPAGIGGSRRGYIKGDR